MGGLSSGDMIANILHVRARASLAQVEAGRQWYPTAGRIVAAIAEATGVIPSSVALVLAALSPRNPWRWNVADAYAFCSASAEGRPMPSATTFGRNRAAAWRVLHDDVPWTSAAPKVRAFAAAVNGHDLPVIDTWAVRVATNGGASRVNTDRQYAAIEAAYVEAGLDIDERACDLQAITWLVAQTEGLASNRRNRHDETFKAGTPEFVRDLLAT